MSGPSRKARISWFFGLYVAGVVAVLVVASIIRMFLAPR
jgi:hypothetical protein